MQWPPSLVCWLSTLTSASESQNAFSLLISSEVGERSIYHTPLAMPLRAHLSLILAACCLAACAPAAPIVDRSTPPTQELRYEATADSLLSLPPNQLTEADLAWLRLYEQRRAQRNAEEQAQEAQKASSSMTQALEVYYVVATIGAVASLVFLLTR